MFIATIVMLINLALLLMIFCFPLIYWFAYNQHVKRMIEHPELGGRPWPSPMKVLLVELLVLAVLLVGGVVSNIVQVDHNTRTVNEMPLEVATYADDELADTWMETYAVGVAEELPGYTLEEYNETDWSYRLFTAEDPDTMHPAFLLFAVYTGEEKNLGCTYATSISDNSGSNSFGSFSPLAGYYLTVGNQMAAECDELSFDTALYTDPQVMQEDFFAEDTTDFASQTIHADAGTSGITINLN